jgi:hypothetical protein
MSPHELELMMFINENFLSASIFNKVMKWACSATADGHKFDSPSYSTFEKTNGLHIPQYYYMNGGALKSKHLRLSLYQKRLDQTFQ